MVYDDVLIAQVAQYIVAAAAVHHAFVLVFIAHAEAYIPDDDVIAADDGRMIGYANAIAGSCLSGNGGIAPDC